MYVVNLPIGPFGYIEQVDDNGEKQEVPVTMSDAWVSFFTQQQQLMQQCLSNEGFLIPSLTATQIGQIEDNALPGTMVFDTNAVNGGSFSNPNGQLYVRLADGTFHPVTNT